MTGWKQWAVGEVVEADDFQNYIQDQVVQVYATSAARGSALGTAVSEGMVSYLEDTNVIEYYTGSAWASVGAPTLTASRAIVSGTAGELTASTVTATEVSYLSGVTSAIQTQLGARVLTTNGAVTTAAVGSVVVRNIAISTATPSGGMDGDVWLQYTP